MLLTRSCLPVCLLAFAALSFVACGSETEDSTAEADTGRPDRPGSGDTGGGGTDGTASDAGVDDTSIDGGDPVDGATPDTGPGEDTIGTDGGGDDTGTPTDTTPADTTPPFDPRCDRDGDGVISSSCTTGGIQGTDCDDNNRNVRPGAAEACDRLDNNCDGDLNEGIECTIYAHTSGDIFLVDPFKGTLERVADAPGLLDFDTSPDGTLYGITNGTLQRYSAGSDTWTEVGRHGIGSGANGMAILTTDTGYVTAGSTTYEINLATAATRSLGNMGGSFTSSGDCVINKDGTLFMSSRGSAGDQLVSINIGEGGTGAATLIGNINFPNVYGLTSAYGTMFGFTSLGLVIEIDTTTGAGTEVADLDETFFGAASSPGR